MKTSASLVDRGPLAPTSIVSTCFANEPTDSLEIESANEIGRNKVAMKKVKAMELVELILMIKLFSVFFMNGSNGHAC